MVDGKPAYNAWFQSIQDPSERYPLDEVVYTDSEGGEDFTTFGAPDILGRTVREVWLTR